MSRLFRVMLKPKNADMMRPLNIDTNTLNLSILTTELIQATRSLDSVRRSVVAGPVVSVGLRPEAMGGVALTHSAQDVGDPVALRR
eukprot:4912110-Pyramimonas_sp.AAC.1